MRAAAERIGSELVLSLAEADPELAGTVSELGFGRDGDRFVRRFPADAAHRGAAAARFPLVAEALVLQTAGLQPVPWDDALAEVARRLDGSRWWLVGSAALAARGARIEVVGGVNPELDEPEPADFGAVAAGRLEVVRWRGFDLLVPPLDLQLRAAERRGLHERVSVIREAIA